jgi:hypothetical protein
LAQAFLFLAQKVGEGDFEAAHFFLGDKGKAILLKYKITIKQTTHQGY